MAGGQHPKVTGDDGRYSEAGHGPEADAASFDRGTPMAGESYRGDSRVTEEPVYVIDETNKQATPPGMLSRKGLTSHGAPGTDKDIVDNTKRVYLLGGVLAVTILVLGGLGLYSVRQDLNRFDEAAEAAAAAKPELPDDMQGVKVRKGMKHNPLDPPKKPGKTIEQENAVPLNTVPDGAPPPPPHGVTEPVAPPPEPTDPATEIPSGAAPQ